MKLNYKVIGEGKPLIILHGIFGSLDNWLSIAKELANHYKVYLLDQRNHGDSPHSDEFNYTVMAEDIDQFIKDHNLQKPSIIGHSMGGKAAMKFAITHTDRWNKLIVVDIGPKAYPVHHQQILDGLKSIHLKSVKSRSDADKQLSQYVEDLGTRQFLLKNLTRNKDNGYEWKLNLKGIDKNIENVGEGLEEQLAIEKEVLFIKGSDSDYILEKDIILIVQVFPNAEVKTIAGAGHWVHAEQPKKLLKVLEEFLR